jgi:hypothetical protein
MLLALGEPPDCGVKKLAEATGANASAANPASVVNPPKSAALRSWERLGAGGRRNAA